MHHTAFNLKYINSRINKYYVSLSIKKIDNTRNFAIVKKKLFNEKNTAKIKVFSRTEEKLLEYPCGVEFLDHRMGDWRCVENWGGGSR